MIITLDEKSVHNISVCIRIRECRFFAVLPTSCELQIAGEDLDVSRAQNRRAFRGSAVAPFLAPLGSGGSVRRLPTPAAPPPTIAHSVYDGEWETLTTKKGVI